jgi:Derlin-2/3
MSESLLTLIIYFWSRRNHAAMFGLWGLIPLRAPYLCYFYLFFDYILESMIKDQLLGIFVAHFYYYFSYIFPELPLSKGVRILKTPEIFKNICKRLGIDNEEENQIRNN